jgi:hypothetical protein
MLSGGLGIGLTVVVSMISAYAFLRLRCRRVGNPFGKHARWWALTIIAITVIVSTGAGMAVVAISHHVRAAYVGILLPGLLWFGKASLPRDRHRQGGLAGALTDFVMSPLRHLDDVMGEDMQEWCDVRSRAVAGSPAWVSEAAHYYYRQVAGRVKDQRARQDLARWLDSIEHKIKIVRLADLDSPARVRAALQSHPATQNNRKYDPDDPRLAERLRSDAENELHLFLFTIYRLGFYKLLIYPFRPPPLPRRKRGRPGASAGAGPTTH